MINIANHNVFLGLNDVGKSNLLNAIRLILDREVRKNNCVEADFYLKNTSEPIIITLSIDITDYQSVDTEKIRAKMKGISLSDEEILYIRLTAKYDSLEQIAFPELEWGGDINNLYPMKGSNSFYEIDRVFNVLYIDSSIDMNKVFAKNAKKLITTTEQDEELLTQIEETIASLNDKISGISGIKDFQNKITQKLSKYRDKELTVSIRSEVAVKGLFDNIAPYIQKRGDTNLYPTAGDGRRKLLAYSILELLSETWKESKINIFLIEEPENHLHKSLQIALSNILFSKNGFSYYFITTHSPFLLTSMQDTQLIRIHNDDYLIGNSTYYQIPEEYQHFKLILNNQLSEALFANKVLLVEGSSEKLLFSYIANRLSPNYEAEGGLILQVDGIKFNRYKDILKALGIKVIIKTDNDLRKRKDGTYSVLGFSRCNRLAGKVILPCDSIESDTVERRRKLYDDNLFKIQKLSSEYSIFLSRCDLENDLDEVMHEVLEGYLKIDPIEYLQQSKSYNMANLLQFLTEQDCRNIYSHNNFSCLKELF
jgi:putative ATP-dependent endonuclease of OLD family